MIAELETANLDTYLALTNREIGTGDPEVAPGLDRRDPVQAFIGDAILLAGGRDDIGIVIMFTAGVEEAVIQSDPMMAIGAFVTENFAGDTQTQLQELLSSLTPEDFANSTYVAQLLMATAPEDTADDISPDEQAQRDLATERRLAVIGLAQPLYNTIHCQEDLPFESVDDVIDSVSELDFPQFVDLDKIQATANGCLNWPVEPASRQVKNPVSSDVPTLILQGAYDKATPVYMGRLAATELENSIFVLVPQQGHEVWKTSGGCVGQIANDFIQDPAADLDLSCLEIRQPQWALPDQ